MIAPLRLPLAAARAVACFALAAPVAAMARVPDWVKPHLAADVAQFAPGHPAVMLFESADVRYLTPDRVRRVYRGILRVRDERGRAHARCVLQSPKRWRVLFRE